MLTSSFSCCENVFRQKGFFYDFQVNLGMGYLELPQIRYSLPTEHTEKPNAEIIPCNRLLPSLLNTKQVYILDSHAGD